MRTWPLPILTAARESLAAYNRFIADPDTERPKWNGWGSVHDCRFCRAAAYVDHNCLECPLSHEGHSLSCAVSDEAEAQESYYELLRVLNCGRLPVDCVPAVQNRLSWLIRKLDSEGVLDQLDAEWHKQRSSFNLAEYMGLTADQWKAWVENKKPAAPEGV